MFPDYFVITFLRNQSLDNASLGSRLEGLGIVKRIIFVCLFVCVCFVLFCFVIFIPFSFISISHKRVHTTLLFGYLNQIHQPYIFSYFARVSTDLSHTECRLGRNVCRAEDIYSHMSNICANFKQLLTKYHFFKKLPQISLIHKNRNFASIIIVILWINSTASTLWILWWGHTFKEYRPTFWFLPLLFYRIDLVYVFFPYVPDMFDASFNLIIHMSDSRNIWALKGDSLWINNLASNIFIHRNVFQHAMASILCQEMVDHHSSNQTILFKACASEYLPNNTWKILRLSMSVSTMITKNIRQENHFCSKFAVKTLPCYLC